MGLFGKSKPADPKEQVNEWCKKIRKEGYNLDRQINAIKREEAKVTRSLKEAAKKGDKESCQILAKELINSRKAVTKLYTAKANLNSVQMQMKSQLATLKVAGTLQTSAEVMKSMSQLVKLPEIQKTMMEMSREMMMFTMVDEGRMGNLTEKIDHLSSQLEDAKEISSMVNRRLPVVLESLKIKLGEEMRNEFVECLDKRSQLLVARKELEDKIEMEERLGFLTVL